MSVIFLKVKTEAITSNSSTWYRNTARCLMFALGCAMNLHTLYSQRAVHTNKQTIMEMESLTISGSYERLWYKPRGLSRAEPPPGPRDLGRFKERRHM
jgi:hypothetical protein